MIYHCGEFALNDRLLELRRAGERVAVQPKVLDLLLFMIRSRTRIVPKEEIFSALWGRRGDQQERAEHGDARDQSGPR